MMSTALETIAITFSTEITVSRSYLRCPTKYTEAWSVLRRPSASAYERISWKIAQTPAPVGPSERAMTAPVATFVTRRKKSRFAIESDCLPKSVATMNRAAGSGRVVVDDLCHRAHVVIDVLVRHSRE